MPQDIFSSTERQEHGYSINLHLNERRNSHDDIIIIKLHLLKGMAQSHQIRFRVVTDAQQT